MNNIIQIEKSLEPEISPMKFLLEDFLAEHRAKSTLNREVERLITSGRLKEAYNLYQTDSEDNVILTYSDFIDSYILTDVECGLD